MSDHNKITECRKQAGLSRYELAKRMGVDSVQMKKFEETNDPHISTLKRVSKALNVSLNRLAGLTVVLFLACGNEKPVIQESRVTMWCQYKADGYNERLAEFVGEHGQEVAFGICNHRAEDLNQLAKLNHYYCTPAGK